MENMMSGARVVRTASPGWYAVPLIAAVALTALLYRTMFLNWWEMWIKPGSYYAHVVFVPFFVGVMVWRKRKRLEAAPWNPSWAGLALLGPTMALLLMADRAAVTVMQSASFVMLMFGTALLLVGRARTRVLLFPLLFLVAIIPMFPDQLINIVAFPIQVKSTQIATALLNLLTLSARREGTMIRMEHYQMTVEWSCSGFRTLVSLLTSSAAFAYLTEGAAWKRWTLFLITAPLSLLINAVRITLIGVVGELVSTPAASTFHDWSGFLALLIAFGLLFYLAQVLGCTRFLGIPIYEQNRDGERNKAPTPGPSSGTEEGPGTVLTSSLISDPRHLRRLLPYVLALDLVLAATLAVAGRVSQRPPSKPPIATFQVPMTLSNAGITWSTMPSETLDKIPQYVEDQLDPTRLIHRDYAGSDGSQIEFFLTAGNTKKTFHDPHLCSLADNMQIEDQGILSIPTHSGVLQVLETRLYSNQGEDSYEMMYFYVVDGKTLQRTEQIHKSLIWQTLFGDSVRPSYFLRFSQRSSGTDPEKRRQLMRFVASMWDRISPIITGKAPGIPQAPPVPADEGAGNRG